MHELTMEQLWSTSQLAGGNVAYIEELFETYLRDPNEVPEEWRNYFDKLPRVDENQHRRHPGISPSGINFTHFKESASR